MNKRLEICGVSLAARIVQVDLALLAGTVTGICGPNGAGKSSLLAVAAGDLLPDAGRVQLDGRDLAAWPLPELARRRGVLPQEHGLGLDFPVLDIIHLGARQHGPVVAVELVDHLAGVLDLDRLLDRRWQQLSGGERQRVQLARVLAQVWPNAQDCVLLLDEPGNHLDPRHELALWALLRDLAHQGATVLVVAHDLSALANQVDKLVLLHQGRVLANGPPEQVLVAGNLRQAFALDGQLQPVAGQQVLLWAGAARRPSRAD